MDHAQAIEKEKEFARRWMRKHGGELPQMSDGDRVNGDPIVYSNNLFPPKLFAMWLDAVESKHGTPVDQKRAVALSALAARIIAGALITPRQGLVLFLRMVGETQQDIADRMGISRITVLEYEKSAKKKLCRESAPATSTKQSA